MERLDRARAAWLAAALCSVLYVNVNAQEIYKWTDAAGKVHYGDRAAAPDNSTSMKVPAGPARARPADPSPAAPLPAALPPPASSARGVPVDPGRVGSACRGLIEKIAAVPAGTSWVGLYRDFDSACPGIAYDCVEYRSSPQRNQCTWIERKDSDVLKRTKYP